MKKKYYIYGYCCAAINENEKINQCIALMKSEYSEAVIIQESNSGMLSSDEWKRLYKQAVELVNAGHDVSFVFDSVVRLSNYLKEGVSIYTDLFIAGIDVYFMNEPFFNTRIYRSMLTQQSALDSLVSLLLTLAELQIRTAIDYNEKRYQDMKTHISEGMKRAASSGKRIGRLKGSTIITHKEVEARKVIVQYSKDFSGTETDQEVMMRAGISRNTYYKYKRTLKQEAAAKEAGSTEMTRSQKVEYDSMIKDCYQMELDL